MTDEEHTQWEVVAEGLEGTGDYRVLRRFRPVDRYAEPDGASLQTGLVLDTETTGIDPLRDEVIELGMVLFEYAPATGRIYRLLDTFDELQDPGRPLPPEITELTHITDAMVRGQHINPDKVEQFVDRASVIIAHNAAFDRPFVEKQWKVFAEKPWGCSMSQIPWREEGIGTRKQELIALCLGFFYDAHRAEHDCRALLNILAAPLPSSRRPALAALLEHALTDDAHIWAAGAPYDCKEQLKERGYHFNSGADGRPKAWHITVPVDQQEAELDFLEHLYKGARAKAIVEKTSPRDRFSNRS